jgi:hypothetical protein
MRAREWAIAAEFGEPEDYDIPELPDWHVYESECGRLTFAADSERFITAENPVKIRR